MVKKLIKQYNISGIISDNRLCVRNKKIPSVFIRHQLNMMTGNTTYFSSKMYQYVIKKHDKCCVPNIDTVRNLSGDLSHLDESFDSIKYIGPISRLNRKKI